MKNLLNIKLTCLAVILASLLTGCAKHPGTTSNLIPSQTKTIPVNTVQNIHLDGPFAINLHTGKKAVAGMTIYATQEQFKHISIKQSGQNLTINDSNFWQSNVPVQINITSPNLRFVEIDHAKNVTIDAGNKGYFDLQLNDVKNVSFYGTAVLPNIELRNSANLVIKQPVTVHNLHRSGQGDIVLHQAQGNNINIDNSSGGGIYIDGNSLGFNQIKQTGNGEVQISSTKALQQLAWVNNGDNGQIQIQAPSISSKQLTISGTDQSQTTINNIKNHNLQVQLSDHARLNLSGSSDVMHVNLENYATFLARNLTVKTAYITSYDFSHAKFTVSHSLFANANDQSLIEYIGYPYTKFVHAIQYATILGLSSPK